jgi:hypothetical protein
MKTSPLNRNPVHSTATRRRGDAQGGAQARSGARAEGRGLRRRSAEAQSRAGQTAPPPVLPLRRRRRSLPQPLTWKKTTGGKQHYAGDSSFFSATTLVKRNYVASPIIHKIKFHQLICFFWFFLFSIFVFILSFASRTWGAIRVVNPLLREGAFLIQPGVPGSGDAATAAWGGL